MPLFFALLLSVTANDWLIVPGERVGPITATTIRADLPKYFASGAIEDDAIELDEGIVQPATLISKGTPSESLAIVWSGKSPDAHPTQVFLCRGRRSGLCRWHTESGITDGVRLDRLEALNERPFTLNGFGLNYGGNVQSWDGGKLASLECGGKLTLTLDGDRRTLTSEERHSIVGDKPVSSTTPAMRRVNPSVTEMVFYFGTGCAAQLKGDPDKGNEVFDEQCAQCHSAYTADSKAGPSLQFLFAKPANAADVLQKIEKGGGKMPAFKDALTPQDKADLLAYLKTL